MAGSQEFIVYVNGEMVPESQAMISALDRGYRWGDAVYDTERTFGGKVFRLDAHLDRLYRSLKYTRINPGLTWEQMEKVTLDVVDANKHLLDQYGDFNVHQVVSRGNLNQEFHAGANVSVYARPNPFKQFAKQYIQGVRAATSATRRTPPESLSPKAKIANKMNHFVSDFEAKQVDPEMWVLMLDLDGNVTEGMGSNFLFVKDGRLKVPNRRHVLPGITMDTIMGFADNMGIPWDEADYTPHDVYMADEAFFCTSTACLIPAKSLNGHVIGDGKVPGPMSGGFLAAFSEAAGFDVVDQAISFLTPDEKREFEAGR